MRLVYVAFGWTAGILLAANNTTHSPSISLIWLMLVGLAGVGLFINRHQPSQRLMMVVLVAFTLGGLRMSLVPRSSEIAAYNHRGGLSIEGVIVAEPDHRDSRSQLTLRAEVLTRAGHSSPISGLVLVQAPRLSDVAYGDRVIATGMLFHPGEFDTFSYADFLGRNEIFSIMRYASVEVIAQGEGNPVLAALLALKDQAQSAINRYLPDPQAALASGILLGNENGIAQSLSDDFQAVGASHVIAISGFNMVILSGAILSLLGRMRVSARWSTVIAILTIGLYTVLVGANAAVVRAAVMSAVLVIGQAIRRKTYVPASLAFVAGLMTLANPMVLWDISFQLSFFATLGLALYVTPLSERFNLLLYRVFPASHASTLSNLLTEPIIVTLAAQVMTLPLVILYFGRVSLVLFIVNLLIIPVQSYLLIIGLLALVASFVFGPLAQFLFWFDLLFLSWTISIVRFFAQFSFADFEFHADARLISLYFLVLIGLAMIQATRPPFAQVFTQFLRRRSVLMAVASVGLGLMALMTAGFMSRPDAKLHVWFLDVGHSNAILVQSPGGALILIDGGRFPARLSTAIGDRIPFTEDELDVLILTQPDEANLSALNALVQRYSVRAVLSHGQPNFREGFVTLQERLSAADNVVVTQGYTLEFDDGTLLEVLHPKESPALDASFDANTLVVRLRYGGASFLFTGDLNADAQGVLLEDPTLDLTSTVLQLPQHATTRSLNADFLAAVQPQMALVHIDRANHRGDPDGDVLALLGETPIFRTDEQGTIHVWTDGESLWVEGERH
jgi:competence protein ComEC